MMTTDETAIVNGMVHDFLDPFDPNDDPQEGGDDPADYDTDKDQDGRCETCHNDGRLCWDCGSIDQPAIGRKIVYLMHNDRPTLLRILAGTPRKQWDLLARAYVAALGTTKQGQAVPAIGVVSLWGMLVREAA